MSSRWFYTVAIITPQGYVDWLLRSPQEPGERLATIDKETHLGNVRGLKLKWVEFTLPEFVRTPQERDTEIKCELVLDGPGTGELAGLTVELE